MNYLKSGKQVKEKTYGINQQQYFEYNMKLSTKKIKGNIQQSLPYENEAKRLYKLKSEDFNKIIKAWILSN